MKRIANANLSSLESEVTVVALVDFLPTILYIPGHGHGLLNNGVICWG